MSNTTHGGLSVADRFQAVVMEDAEQHIQSAAKRATKEMERVEARREALDQRRETVSKQLEETSAASVEAQKGQNIGTAIAGLFGFGSSKAHKLQMETARLQADLEKAEIQSARLENRAADLASTVQQAVAHLDRASSATQGARQDGQRKTGGGQAGAAIARATELQTAEGIIANARTATAMERSGQVLDRIGRAADQRFEKQMQAIGDRHLGFSLSRVIRAGTSVVGALAGATTAASIASLSPLMGALGPLGALVGLASAAVPGVAVSTITLTGTSSLPQTALLKAGMDAKAGHLELDAEAKSNAIKWSQEELDDASASRQDAEAQSERIRKLSDKTNSVAA
jgi:hypothetical protein